jgi:hypothetical protein
MVSADAGAMMRAERAPVKSRRAARAPAAEAPAGVDIAARRPDTLPR